MTKAEKIRKLYIKLLTFSFNRDLSYQDRQRFKIAWDRLTKLEEVLKNKNYTDPRCL